MLHTKQIVNVEDSEEDYCNTQILGINQSSYSKSECYQIHSLKRLSTNYRYFSIYPIQFHNVAFYHLKFNRDLRSSFLMQHLFYHPSNS